MKQKTSKNFALVIDILQDVGNYTRSESERIAIKLFKESKSTGIAVDVLLADLMFQEDN